MSVRRAWLMHLHEGAEEAYEAAHRDIWPDMLESMRAGGVERFAIYRHGTTLFAYQERHAPLPEGAPVPQVVRRWWARMEPLMQCEPDGRPVQSAMSEMFFVAFDAPAREPS